MLANANEGVTSDELSSMRATLMQFVEEMTTENLKFIQVRERASRSNTRRGSHTGLRAPVGGTTWRRYDRLNFGLR